MSECVACNLNWGIVSFCCLNWYGLKFFFFFFFSALLQINYNNNNNNKKLFTYFKTYVRLYVIVGQVLILTWCRDNNLSHKMRSFAGNLISIMISAMHTKFNCFLCAFAHESITNVHHLEMSIVSINNANIRSLFSSHFKFVKWPELAQPLLNIHGH